jgi:hypothetical protein
MVLAVPDLQGIRHCYSDYLGRCLLVQEIASTEILKRACQPQYKKIGCALDAHSQNCL